ncbi:MAG: hypothetical protein DHS20C14_03220 [Phycisphaeraceae bacterium]|nr:MAG: hypothetical protein DHS20C14_03220 [Phycisphaeraceae bacterium]
MLRFLFVLVVTGLAGPSARAGSGPAEPRIIEQIPAQPYWRYETTDALDRTVTFFVSEPPGSDADLPLLVYVQGSGCSSHFAQINGRIASTTGHSLVEQTARGRARVLLVEKPGVEYLDAPQSPGSAEHASDAFKQEHTLDRWATAVVGAIHAAWGVEGIDPSRTIVIGHSEGGIVASRVAVLEPEVTRVGVFAGEGPTQLYSLIRLAREGHVAPMSDDPGERAAYITDGYRRVLSDPDAWDRMFLGHPFRRWSTFLRTSPAEQLRACDASVLIVQGTEDTAVDPSCADMLYAELLALGRDVELMLFPGVDHSLNTLEDGELTGTVFPEAVERALDGIADD